MENRHGERVPLLPLVNIFRNFFLNCYKKLTFTISGELFDHGCDAWAAVFITSTFYSTFGNNADGFSISATEMYFIHVNVFLSFYLRLDST